MSVIRINREAFLHCLETTQAGISTREIIEQSSCFVFRNGEVFTSNDEIACRSKIEGLDGFEGAIKSEKLLGQLRKAKEDELTMDSDIKDGHVVFTGKKGREFGIQMEKDILLKDNVEQPKKWKPLPEDFAEAIGIVGQCAGQDQTEYSMTCVHIHPNWIEATDRYQICRWTMETGVDASTIVRQSSIRHIVPLGMTKYSITDTWIHFKNPSGLILSCRRGTEADATDFQKIEDLKLLEVDGMEATLPKSLADAIDKAQEFTKENADNDRVFVKLMPGKLRITGQGITGYYKEPFKIKYDGPTLTFLISTTILMELVKKHSECVISKDKLKVDTGRYQFIACLLAPEEEKKMESEVEE